MDRVDKENYYLDIAQSVLERSTCLRRKYGAIIVRNDEIVSTGYNGAPRGRKNCVDLGRCTREELQVPSGQRYELCRSVHAEANAIISAARRDILGGTLYQDIKPLEHVPHNDHWAKVHTVTLRRGTLLSEIVGQDTLLVNSQHHQAADKPAPGLVVSALSEDGFIEGLERPDARFCLGVQWHPEWLSDADPRAQALFDAFVKACR